MEDERVIPDGMAAHERGFKRWLHLYALAWTPFIAAYLLIFLVTTRLGPEALFSTLASNIVFPFVFGLGIYGVMLRWLVHEKAPVQILVHIAGSAAFSLLWAGGLFRGLQIIRGLTTGDWSFSGFSGPALVWQLYQGLAVYYLIAAGTYAVYFFGQLKNAPVADGVPETENRLSRDTNILSRFFAKSGDEILPVELKDVVNIRGADDYAEILTENGKHLSRLTLKEWGERLDPAFFVRVHRSHIVNTAKILSLEPAGEGRLSIHMSNGETVVASRTGAQELRKRVI